MTLPCQKMKKCSKCEETKILVFDFPQRGNQCYKCKAKIQRDRKHKNGVDPKLKWGPFNWVFSGRKDVRDTICQV